MFERFFAFGIRQLFGGARRGQPTVAALGMAVTLWGLFRKLSRGEKMLYTRDLADGETLTIKMMRGKTVVADSAAETATEG